MWLEIPKLLFMADLTDKMKRSFFQAAVVSILLYGCTIWMLTKRLEKKLDGNYTRMLRAILNKSWWQHPTRHQLYGHLPPITKTIQVRRTRHAGNCIWMHYLDANKTAGEEARRQLHKNAASNIEQVLVATIWMHYLDANKTAGEEARRQLHKNAASNIEQVLVATPHKAPTIRPPASHHENYPS